MSAHAEWKQVMLGDVVSFPGGTARVPVGAGVRPTLTFKGLRATGVLDLDDAVPAEDAESKSMTALQPGDVVATAQGHATGWILKKVGHIAADTPLAYAASTLQVMRPRPDRLEDRFLLHYLSWPLTYRRVTDMAGPRRSFTAKMFGNIPIPLPPIEEQRRIAAVLDAADELRAKRREALVKLDTLTRAIFIDMFGDPVSNPRGWTTVPLTELGTLDRGVSKHRPRNDPALLGGQWPLIQTGDVASSEGYIRAAGGSYSDLGLAQSRLWPAGTLCITIAANIAKTGILTFDACFPDSVVGFTSDPATTEFVRAFLGFLQPVLEANAPESAQKNINLKTLRTAEAPLPPSGLREQFAQAVDGVRAQHARLTGSGQGLDGLFASLQQRAFRGDL